MTTSKYDHDRIELTEICDDWTYASSRPADWPKIPHIASIEFQAGAPGDHLIMFHNRPGGPVLFNHRIDDAAVSVSQVLFGSRALPALTLSSCRLSPGHRVCVKITHRPVIT